MKIGIICYPTHGGSGVIASELAVGLAKRGHEIHIVSYATPFRLGSFHQNIFVHEVEVASYPIFKYPPYALALATKLVDISREYGLDIIHAHYAIPHATSAYLAKQMLSPHDLKTITTLHGTDITLVGANKSFHQAIKFNIEKSDGVTAVSHYLQQRTLQEFNINREIRVIHNFVDTGRYSGRASKYPKQHFAPMGEKILMHASNFRAVKRVEDVVYVFARIQTRVPAKLLLVGEGPDRLLVQQKVKELNLSDSVVFLGEQDYVEELMSCADLFILPSEQESFGLAALEAQSFGIPVIGTNVGGLPEVVAQGETGFLLPIGDIKGMAEKALDLLESSDRYDTFCKKARARVLHDFDSQLMIPKYEAYYQEIFDQKSG
ncbi:MAG: N-acetyl-alpha-D-glucosaminyl L-malate synthase BshA [Acidobacteriota bacterium]|nr:N-acetyl-alpha-D-glucosaminyl L-malate synthase BshA [Acidobacteriota bacterium]